jgi:hypothetical protein
VILARYLKCVIKSELGTFKPLCDSGIWQLGKILSRNWGIRVRSNERLERLEPYLAQNCSFMDSSRWSIHYDETRGPLSVHLFFRAFSLKPTHTTHRSQWSVGLVTPVPPSGLWKRTFFGAHIPTRRNRTLGNSQSPDLPGKGISAPKGWIKELINLGIISSALWAFNLIRPG